MGRTPKAIDENAPGRELALFKRDLLHEARLTFRAISEKSHHAHTTLSQNCDGRLRGLECHLEWIDALYTAAEKYRRVMTTPKETALQHARELWNQASRRQREGRMRATTKHDSAANAAHPPPETASPALGIPRERPRPSNQVDVRARAQRQEPGRWAWPKHGSVSHSTPVRPVPPARPAPAQRPTPSARPVPTKGSQVVAEFLRRWITTPTACPRCAASLRSPVPEQPVRWVITGGIPSAVPTTSGAAAACCTTHDDMLALAIITCLLAAAAASSPSN